MPRRWHPLYWWLQCRMWVICLKVGWRAGNEPPNRYWALGRNRLNTPRHRIQRHTQRVITYCLHKPYFRRTSRGLFGISHEREFVCNESL